MTQRIGIMGEDSVILAAVYRRMLELTPVERIQDHADVALYARQLTNTPGRSPRNTTPDDQALYSIFEGTEAVFRPLSLNAAFCVDLDIPGLLSRNGERGIPNRLPLFFSPNVRPLTSDMIEGIRENVLHQRPPEDPGLRARYDGFMEQVDIMARFIKDHLSHGREDAFTLAEKPPSRAYSRMAKSAFDPMRHANGFGAIHGGLGPEAGLSFMEYIISKSPMAVVLMSDATTPNAADHIMELLRKGRGARIEAEDPVARIRTTGDRLRSLKPDFTILACNTAHYYYDEINHGRESQNVVHLVAEGMRQVPPGSTVLMLATEPSIQSHIFLDKLEQDSVGVIYPTPEEQRLISQAIWQDIMRGNYAEGERKIGGIIDGYRELSARNMFDGNLHCYLGCTEFELIAPFIEQRMGGEAFVIDPKKAACDTCISISEQRVAERTRQASGQSFC